MSLLNKIEQLSNKEKVFVFCNSEKTPTLFVTKIISKSLEGRFIVFESKLNNIKIGVKLIRREIKYSKFNKKHNCQTLADIISEKNEIEFKSLLLKKKQQKQKQIEKTLTIQKTTIPFLKITAGSYIINTVKTTLKQDLKTYIKKLIEIDKTYRGFAELLSNDETDYPTQDAHIFIDMIPDEKQLIEIQQIINHEYQPILNNLLQNNFNLTNISPIVIDKKKIFIRDAEDDIALKKTNEQFNNTFLIKNLLNVHDAAEDDTDIGDIPLELNITKNFINSSDSSVKSYIDFIRKLNGHEGVTLETELDKEFTESSPGTLIPYTPPHLSYLLPQKGHINNLFYPITLKSTTDLFRHSYTSSNNLNTGCATLKFDDEGKFTLMHEKSNKITFRKSEEAIYYLHDVYDDIKIGNTKTCNGTNKSGDIFYLGKDFKSSELNKSQSKPPQKIPIYEGEEIYVCGFFIHSPNDYKNIIGGSETYDFDKHSKEYPSLYTNYKTLVDIQDIKNRKKPVKIIEDITNFSLVNYSNYDPKYDYFILIGSVDPSETKNKLTTKQWNQNIKYIAPSLKQIFHILKPELGDIRGVLDIEKILNKYYFSLARMPQAPFINILKKIIYKNNKNAKELTKEHYKNLLNLKNQSKIMNNLFRELLTNEEEVYHFLDFLNKHTLKKTVHKKLLKKLYTFISGKKLKKTANIEDQIIKLVSRNFKHDFLNKLDDDIIDKIKKYYNKLHPSTLTYQNTVFAPRIIEHISKFNNSKKDYISKNILKSIIELANLYKIEKIVNEEVEKNDFDMEEEITVMEKNIADIVNTYNAERASQLDFLTRCKGIRIVKEYSSLKQVNNDNTSNIYRDLQYDTLYSDLNSLFNIIGSVGGLNSAGIRQFKPMNTPTRDAMEAALIKKYIYLDTKTIQFKLTETLDFYDTFRINSTDANMGEILNLLENYDETNKKRFYNLRVAAYPIRNSIKPEDIALLEMGDNKYLFKRSANVWHIITESEFGETKKAFIHADKNILRLKTNELEKLFMKINPASVDSSSHCVNIEEYSVPIELYNLISEISNKKHFIKNCRTIIKYKHSIESDIAAKINDIETKFKFQGLIHKKQQLPNIITTKERKPSRIPKSIINKYLDIFKIRDFDKRLRDLLEFVELYGINYCLADSCEESEKSSATSVSYWYNSSTFAMRLCCKHEMCYKDFIHKNDIERNEILQGIKDEYGRVEGERHICRLCGEGIDYIKGSAFEGFDRGNALIMFREEVKDADENVEIYEEDLSIQNEKEFYNKYTKQPEILALKYIITELGITLREDDLKFILTKIDALSTSKLYETFINTNIIKTCMIKIFKFTQTLHVEKSKESSSGQSKKKKKKKKGTMRGGTIINTKIKDDIFARLKKSGFVKKIKQVDEEDFSNLENVFKTELQEAVSEFNKIHTHRPISTDENLLLKNIGDINKLLHFLNDSDDSNVVIIVLLANIQQLFNMYIRGYKFIMSLTYLIVILQYSLPEYKINPYVMISKNPSLRSSGKNYLIQNLYHSRDYIISSIFTLMQRTIDNKKTANGFYIKKITSIFENILGAGLKFSPVPRGKVSKETKKQMFLNNLIIFEKIEIDEIKGKKNKLRTIHDFFVEKIKTEADDSIVSAAYINDLKVKRIAYEHSREFKEDFTLKWDEFLPIIETDTLNSTDLSETFKITKATTLSIYELNKHLSKLCNNYIFLINKLINLINTHEDMSYYSYTSSTIFSNIMYSFTDYFNIKNFEENKIEYPAYLAEEPVDGATSDKDLFNEYINKLHEILSYMNVLNTKLSYQRNEVDSPIYVMTNNNMYVRNLQEYTNFDILYENKAIIYYINRLKLLFTTYYINEGHHLNPLDTTIIEKKRNFKTIKDTHYDVILSVLKEQIETLGDGVVSGDDSGRQPFNLIRAYTELIGENRNVIVDEILKQDLDEELGANEIFFSGDNKGVYNIDIETGEFKEKLEYSIEQKYIQKDIAEIRGIIELIESKIYKVYDKQDQSITFDDEITFETNYILTIGKINSFLREIFTGRGDTLNTITELGEIINLEETDIRDITEKWTELNSITFVASIGVVQEGVIGQLHPKYKTLFKNIFIENDHQLDKFYIEKLEEIENDLRIILFEEEIEREQVFYQEKLKSDGQQNTLSIFIYLLKFLICKSLMIYKNYKNNVLVDLDNDPPLTKFTLDSEDIGHIRDIYTKRYANIQTLDTISHLEPYISTYEEICKNTYLLISLINENSLSISHNIAFVKDLILKLLYSIDILFINNDDYVDLVNTLFMEELSSIFETFKTREYDIRNYMNIKKTKGNQNRKRQFDKKSDEDKLSHKLYRRFNLGKILDLSDNIYKETTTASVETEDPDAGYNTFDGNADI